MLQSIRGAEDTFVFLASPLANGAYGVMIYPPLPEVAPEVEVTKRRLRIFLARHRKEIAVEAISGSNDIFVSAMTADGVRELMDGAPGVRRCATRFTIGA